VTWKIPEKGCVNNLGFEIVWEWQLCSEDLTGNGMKEK